MKTCYRLDHWEQIQWNLNQNTNTSIKGNVSAIIKNASHFVQVSLFPASCTVLPVDVSLHYIYFGKYRHGDFPVLVFATNLI